MTSILAYGNIGLFAYPFFHSKEVEYFKMEVKMNNLILIRFFFIEVAIGLASTLYLALSLFVVLGQKIYRKCKYGASLYD